jgi:hypothetical protein
MGTVTRSAIALRMLVAVAWTPTTAVSAAPDPTIKLAAPTAQEETIYRPECPSDEISSGWLSCRVAGAGGG